MNLANKYRPKYWKDLVEQDAVKQILEYQLQSKQFSNAYLFTGSAGTGKTTSARIFANEINNWKGEPIEMDAASNNGVDDVRKIIDGSKFKSISGGEYKCYIIDECFAAGTMVTTRNGEVPIENISIGEEVASMTGFQKVTNVLVKKVPVSNVVCVTVNGKKIITTNNHLFFTENGWIQAKNLVKGDKVYVYSCMQELWKNLYKQKKELQILHSCMLGGLQKQTTFSVKTSEDMCSMWNDFQHSKGGISSNLLDCLQEQTNIYTASSSDELRLRTGVVEVIVTKNEELQSNVQPCEYTKNDTNQTTKRNSSSVERTEGWKWNVHDSAVDAAQSIRKWLDNGIRNSDKNEKPVSYKLQSRPRLTKQKISDRGGWQRTSLEKQYIERCKENESAYTARVDCVEVYEPSNNQQLYVGGEQNTRSDQKYIIMYDLEVENDSCYFVENILVHNCHQLTQAAWAAMLKLLEEPPSKSIFLLCTTDPQKIPDTILSRVLRFDFQKITHSSVVNRLNYILQQEQASEDGLNVQGWDQEALSYIAKIANGGMRDAITMLDKCLNYSNNLTVEAVVKALGVTNYDQMFSILNGFVNKNEAQLMSNIENLYSSGTDLKQFIKSFIQFVLDLCKFDLFQDFQYVQIPPSFQSTLMQYSKENYIYFRKLLEMLINVNYKIKWETNPKMLIQTEFLLEILK